MKQNNPLKNSAAGDVATTQNSVSDQIRIAKEKQKANARQRAAGAAGRKSMAAVTTTPEQSEITNKPPNLYQVTRINTPADFPEVARLLSRELNKIAESQSYILTLWEKLKGSTELISFQYDNGPAYPLPHYVDSLNDTLDINTLMGTHYGQYMQGRSAWAISELNYPEVTAGLLIVNQHGANGADGCIQEYQPYNQPDHFWRRTYDPANGWSSWFKYTGVVQS